MNRAHVTTILAEILADLGLDAHDLREEQNLRETLEFDSLDLIALAVAVDERLGVTIEVADAEGLITVGNVIDLLMHKLADRPPPARAA